jgi:quercetin dioxygenase-like cupin family protein
MNESKKFDLNHYPVHLGLNAKASVQDEFTGDMGWYERYGARNEADGAEGRLVTLHAFSTSWPTWEMHPDGDEVVACIQGRMTLIQEINGEPHHVELTAGEAIINPRGVWHTADIHEKASALFITAGQGTQIRLRD